jgi:hypothetical protein
VASKVAVVVNEGSTAQADSVRRPIKIINNFFNIFIPFALYPIHLITKPWIIINVMQLVRNPGLKYSSKIKP